MIWKNQLRFSSTLIRYLPHLAVIALLLASGASGCSDERNSINSVDDSHLWVQPNRSVGDIHNAILERYYDGRVSRSEGAKLMNADLQADFRAAVLAQVALDTKGDTAAIQEVKSILDGPAFVEIQRRFDEVAHLVRVGHPDPLAVKKMLEGWELDPADAATLGKLFSYALLDGSLSAGQGGRTATGAEDLFRDVFRSSATYWYGSHRLAKSAATSEVIVADAVGALGGLAFGAIGSIIGGAAYSIFWDQTEPEPQPGGCGSCH